ncbi:membrane protein [Marinobacterium stanieri]|uniref:COG4648 family protein n=1 Tax=Marinobacterium stanieri TaxID=49186 RepID=UPI00025583F5|nr:membrane protein [Marinobacterium stanieri]
MPIRILVTLLTLSYPFAVYWGLQHFDALSLLPVLLLMLLLRWQGERQVRDRMVIIVSALGVLLVTLLWDAQLGLKFYPVLVNLGLLVVFASSLFASQTVIERLARISEPDLPPAGVAYTRKVTQAWCVFFVVNGSVSMATLLWASEATWMLYNGLIAYLLIGAMLGAEWLIRQRVRSGQ